jgi:hypothetical protein
MMYDKMPWDLGYPHWEEFDNIMPFIIGQVHNRRKRDEEISKDFEDKKREIAGIK